MNLARDMAARRTSYRFGHLIEQIVHLQVEAIRNIEIDKVTVWGSAGGQDGTSTANFLAGMIKSLPPLHEVAGLAGIELPKYLGRVTPDEA